MLWGVVTRAGSGGGLLEGKGKKRKNHLEQIQANDQIGATSRSSRGEAVLGLKDMRVPGRFEFGRRDSEGKGATGRIQQNATRGELH